MPTSKSARASTGSYDQLVKGGHYDQMPSGLWGKYDNVRRYWENQVTRFALQSSLRRLNERARQEKRGIRILDMGCGSGEGWNLLQHVPREAGGDNLNPHILQPDDVELFHGVDLSKEMIVAARRRFDGNKTFKFDVCDLSQPGDILGSNAPYDLYFSSYGSPSHLDDNQLTHLLQSICIHAKNRAVVVLDLLGQFSPEWPCQWGYTRSPDVPRLAPYNMVWLYPPAEQHSHRPEFNGYRVRYWGGREVERFLRGIPEINERIETVTRTDRSIFCGRHLDTCEFNRNAKPLRRAVNGLFEFNYRTSPDALLSPPLPLCFDPEIASFFENYSALWNATIDAYRAAISKSDARTHLEAILKRFELPELLRRGYQSALLQQEAMGWLEPGDPLSNTLQPQFALLLRQLEFHMQRGLGCGHGLIVVIELNAGRQACAE